MKTLTKITKFIFKIILSTSIIGLVLVIIWIFIWWMPWMSFEVPWNKLTETYLKVWDYKIGKQKFQHNICHKKDWCIIWKILWLKIDENDYIYIYYELNHSNGYIWVEKENFYAYRIYKNYEISDTIIYDLNDLPKFFILTWSSLNLYSENDLETLPQEQQEIFKELEENPSIIINWEVYK
jgi:hypothetical protein